MFDKTITIVNKWFNKSTKLEEYKTHQVKAHWENSQEISINDIALVKADSTICYIKMSEKGYKSPKEYQEAPDNSWTLKNDDYLVKGIVKEINTIAELKDNYECIKVKKVSTMDYGSEDMQHWEISGE